MLPNGYALTVEGQEYMYFTPTELLEGMFYHVGLEKTGYMDKQTIHDLMFAAATWPNAEDAVQDAIKLTAENARLTKDLGALKHKMGKLTEKYEALMDEIAEYRKKAKEAKSDTKHITRAEAGCANQKPLNIIEKAKNMKRSFISKGELAQPTKKHIKVSPVKQKLAPPDTEKIYRLLMSPIKELKLPTRVKSALLIVGGKENKTVGDAVIHSREDFVNVRGCGSTILTTLEAWLTANHLDFGFDVESIMFAHAKKSATV